MSAGAKWGSCINDLFENLNYLISKRGRPEIEISHVNCGNDLLYMVEDLLIEFDKPWCKILAMLPPWPGHKFCLMAAAMASIMLLKILFAQTSSQV
jgi:hypothetical protein